MTILRLESLTYAMKASRLLKRNSISCHVVKLGDKSREGGCGYGIKIPSDMLYTSVAILRNQGFEYTIYE